MIANGLSTSWTTWQEGGTCKQGDVIVLVRQETRLSPPPPPECNQMVTDLEGGDTCETVLV